MANKTPGKAEATCGDKDPAFVPIGISNRHIHLSRCDMDALFGPGASLTRKKAMKQPGQYAAEETVVLRDPKGELKKVQVLSPLRKETQIEISKADGFVLGICPPLRLSGHLEGSPGLGVIGPHGTPCTRITASSSPCATSTCCRRSRRSSASPTATKSRWKCPENAAASRMPWLSGRRKTPPWKCISISMHIDIEEANAFGLKNDDLVRIGKV
ncbi:PduL/EutD family phosphate acyltransferase [Breoghania sp.]|uniref:PduL/EutD family phosphate acyltransferase n=1 Tax=Breoghania sp. TaxID=2065378 RepID=UPI00262BE76E|nr:PduL/EutD family phosphate acyltransferase [Breoghania sp.]MDJ0932687.1 PduL/EutD family phosphate acyltransferase [Breoghania sp.]